jgi:peptidyl-prolyl cis-trans isomerase SurA
LWPFSGVGYSAEELVDRLIAEVGGEAITQSEIRSKVEKGPLIEVSPFPAKETDDPWKVALEDLVNKKLILQKAVEVGIDVSEENLEQEIKSFLQRRNLTKESLNAALSQQGMTYEQYKEDFKTQMVINQFEGRELMPQVKVTDRDVQLFYIKNSGALAENVKLSLKQLAIQIPSSGADSVKEAKKQVVEKAYQELEAGMPFDQAVKIYSDDEESRKTGGEMAPIFLKDLAPNVQAVVKELEEGKFSKPIVLGASAFIFFVSKREFAGSEDYLKQKPQLEASLRQEEMGRLLSRWLEAQRRRTDIKIKGLN